MKTQFPASFKPLRSSLVSALCLLFPLIASAQSAEFMEVCDAMESIIRSNGYTIVDAGYVDAVGRWAGEITSGELTVNPGEHYTVVMLVDQCGGGCDPYVVWQEWGERYEIASETYREGDCMLVMTVVNDDDFTNTGEVLGGVDSQTPYSAYMIVGRGPDSILQAAAGGDTSGIDTFWAMWMGCCTCIGLMYLLTLLM